MAAVTASRATRRVPWGTVAIYLTLALGALPVMAHAGEEVEEMARIASSLVLNIGTLSRPWVDAMRSTGTV